MAYAPKEINPSISTLVENSQRANPALGKKTKENVEPKKTKPHLSSRVSSDMTDLSDDLMGDMDPDESGHKDHLSSFRRHIEEMREEADKENNASEENESEISAKTCPDRDINDDKNDPYVEASGTLEEHSEDVCNKNSIDIEISDKAKDAESEDFEEEYPENTVTKEDFEEEKSDFREEIENQINSIAVRVKEIFNGGETASVKSENEEIRFDSPFESLLGFTDGFIIADPKKKTVPSHSHETEESREYEQETKEVNIIPSALNERFSKSLDEIIICDIQNESYRSLRRQLKSLGIGVLEACESFGTKILLLPEKKSLRDYRHLLLKNYPAEAMKMRHGYFPDEKMAFISEEEILKKESRFRVAVLYFAFAFDHALGGDKFASEKSPAVLAAYKACKNNEAGHQFIDGFSSLSPAHYFAQAVETFSGSSDGIGEKSGEHDLSILCAKEEFYDIDRPFYMYIEYLLRRINRGGGGDETPAVTGEA